jgi:hypothetical protein
MKTGMRILALVLFVTGAAVDVAVAQTLDLRSKNQVPGLIDQVSDTVTLTNRGADAVNILYWDGAWKPVEISSGQTVALKGQGSGLSVSFNDGTAAKSIVLNVPIHYAIYLDSGRWDIAPWDEVERKLTGLRSR